MGEVVETVAGGVGSIVGGLIGGRSEERAAERAGQFSLDAAIQAALIQAEIARELANLEAGTTRQLAGEQATLARDLAREGGFPTRTEIPGLGVATFDPNTRSLFAGNFGDTQGAIQRSDELRGILEMGNLNAFGRGLGPSPAIRAELDRARAGLRANLFGRGRLGVASGFGTVNGAAVQPEMAALEEGITRGLLQEERAGQSHLLQSYLQVLGSGMDLRETPLRLLAAGAQARGVPATAPQLRSPSIQSPQVAINTGPAQAGIVGAGQDVGRMWASFGSFIGNQVGSIFNQGNQFSNLGVNRATGRAALNTGEPIPF